MTQNTTQVPSNQVVNARPANGQTQPTVAELMARIAELEAEKTSGVTFKCYALGEKYTDKKGVTHEGKGVLSLYGLGQFPVSLYDSQWDVIEHVITSGKLAKAREQFKTKLAHKS